MTDANRGARVESQRDVELVRRRARLFGSEAGLDAVSAAQLSLAVSELATNLVRYARGGHILMRQFQDAEHAGVEVTSSDDGPGIASVESALRDGFSTGAGMGSGLPSVNRMMDSFSIQSDPRGTRIVAQKWVGRSRR